MACLRITRLCFLILTINTVCIITWISASAAADKLKLSSVSEDFDDGSIDQIDKKLSEEDKKILIENLKQNFLKALGFNKVPHKRSNKIVIPHGILQLYKNQRESAIDVIPDDKDYYGKIPDHIYEHDGNMWNSGDIEIDFEQRKKASHSRSKRYSYRGASDTVTCLTLKEFSELPGRLEHQLPPHSRGTKIKIFKSMHLKFNFSQNSFNPPINELIAAELRLVREKPPHFETQFNKKAQPSTRWTDRQPSEQDSLDESVPNSTMQRVYVLQVLDYDIHGEPIARIVDSKKIDTSQTSTLIFDIYGIIKHWLLKPDKNLGLIVRVTDDNEVNSVGYTVEKPIIEVKVPRVVEHVRLTREFGYSSEVIDSWVHKQPMIYVYTRNPKFDRQFDSGLARVKRYAKSQESDNHSSSTTTAASELKASSRGSPPARSSNKRAQNAGANNNRTATSSKSASSHRDRPQKPRSSKPEKCSKRSLVIDFAQVGWDDWIVAPHSYSADFCAGDCSFPLNDHQNATNHAVIQGVFKQAGRVTIPKPCCAPTKYSSIAILFKFDDVVQLKNYNEMVVDSCGCL